jgi:hypothetical protein
VEGSSPKFSTGSSFTRPRSKLGDDSKHRRAPRAPRAGDDEEVQEWDVLT